MRNISVHWENFDKSYFKNIKPIIEPTIKTRPKCHHHKKSASLALTSQKKIIESHAASLVPIIPLKAKINFDEPKSENNLLSNSDNESVSTNDHTRKNAGSIVLADCFSNLQIESDNNLDLEDDGVTNRNLLPQHHINVNPEKKSHHYRSSKPIF